MRQIKFRAWDKSLNRWNHYMALCIYDAQKVDFIELNQFTGLLDKNGNEIFEGDIVQQFSDDDLYFRYVVIFKKGAFGYLPHGEDYDFIPYAGNPHFKWTKDSSDKIEIIGNIYENPELLTEKRNETTP